MAQTGSSQSQYLSELVRTNKGIIREIREQNKILKSNGSSWLSTVTYIGTRNTSNT